MGLSQKRQPPLRHDCYLREHTRSGDGGTTTVYASVAWWQGVDERARKYGESVSESVRALLHGGLLVDAAPPPEEMSLKRILDAMEDQIWRPSVLAQKLWPDMSPQFGGHSGAYAVERALAILEEKSLVLRTETGKWARAGVLEKTDDR